MNEQSTYLEMVSQLELKNRKLNPLVEITDYDVAQNSFYSELRAGYERGLSLSTSSKVVHSLLHYLVREECSVFVCSTDRVREVYVGDPNWKDERSFNYKELRRTLISLEYLGVKKIVSSKNNIPAVLIVLNNSPVFPYIRNENEEDILSAFKEAEVTIDRFVDEETKEYFKKYLI